MKIIEVPIYNSDGSVNVTHQISPEEAQSLLHFAINFLTAAGMAGAINIAKKNNPQAELPLTVQ